MKYVVIPDVHADLERLRTTMASAGFAPHQNGFRSENGQKAIFLGDLIDNGPQNREVIESVRATVDDGEAMCLMGNHELNAIMMHNGFREKSDKNLAQHTAFLREFRFDDEDTREVIRWFTSLPLRVQVGDVRAAHAFWGDDEILSPLTRTTQNGSLTLFDVGLLPDLAAQASGIASEILDVTKGPEVRLPPGDFGFADHYGKWRTEGRMRWWGNQPETWEDAMISLHGERRLPPGRPSADIISRAYPSHSPLLFIGHYKMKGEVSPVAQNVVCLDFPHEFLYAEVSSETADFAIRKADAAPQPEF